MRIGDIIFYRLTIEESQNNNHQFICPAIVLACFPNEFFDGNTTENNIGVNLKVFTIDKDLLKYSVRKGDTSGTWCYDKDLTNKFLMQS